MAGLVTLWTDYGSAGGQRLGTLVVVSGTERTRVDGNETTALTIGRARWLALGGDVRMVVRIVWPEGTVSERRISTVRAMDTEPTTQIELLPLFADLSTGGPILRSVGGRVVTRVAGSLTVSQALAAYVMPHPAAQGVGLVLGSIARDIAIPFDLDAPTPAAMIRDLFQKSGNELEIVRTSDTIWTLRGLAARGSDQPTLRVQGDRNQARLALSVDDQQLATVVVPLGDADPVTGDRATLATAQWAVGVVASGGWVPLRDPADPTQSPITVDTQWAGAWVVSAAGFTQQILSSRVSDGAVQLPNTAGLTAGMRVRLSADAAGAPLTTVYDASSIGSRRRTVPLMIQPGRGEANEIRDGQFAQGVQQWTAANPQTPPAFVEIPRSALGTTRSGLTTAARAAATGVGTPFGLKGLPANAFVRQGAELRIAASTLTVTADAIPTTAGALSLTVASPGLPGALADNTPLTLVRTDVRTLTLDGDQSPLSPALQFRDVNTDGLPSQPFLAIAGTLASGVYTGPFQYVAYVDAPAMAGRVRLQTEQSNTQRGAITWGTILADVYTFDAGTTLAYVVGETTGTVTFTSTTSGAPAIGTRVRYYGSNNVFQLLRVTARTGAVLTIVTDNGLPIVGRSGVGVLEGCDVVLADGTTWTVTLPRETRTLLINGAQVSGATVLPFKTQANLSTRQWVATDTLRLTRALSATLAITSVTSTVGFEDEFGNPILGMEASVTFDAAASTIDELGQGTDWSVDEVVFALGGPGEWVLAQVSGTTAVLFNRTIWLNPDPFTAPQTATAAWVRTDVYALSGTATWGATGRVTLTLASAVPAGRSYARGARADANWTSGTMRLHAALNAAATSVEVTGTDQFTAASAPAASLMGALYRVFASGSTLPVAGNILYAAATAQANGSGDATVTLAAANANAITADQPVTIPTPDLVRPSDVRTGSVVRLLAPVGGSNIPTGATAGIMTIAPVPVVVPGGASVPITAFVTMSLSAGTYALGQQPAIALVDQAGAVLAWARLADGSVEVRQTPTIARLILTHVLTATTAVTLRIYGGATNRALWAAVLDAMLCITDRDDVPFIEGSWANVLAHRAASDLAARRDPAVAVDLDLTTLRRWVDAPSAPVAVGQPVHLPAYGLTRRILGIDRDVVYTDQARVEIGAFPDTLTQQIGAPR